MDNIQLTLESSTTSLSLNSDSIYLNPEIDGLAGLPEIRTTSGVNAGYNGGWTSAQFYDARLITIRGVISDSDISVVEDRRKALVGLLGQGRKEELTLHFVTAGGNSYVLNCRTISCEMALSGLARKQEFLIQLRADDPLIYDDGALATEAIVNVRRALGGFQIDFGLPLYIGGGVNETLVENGNETVYPVINLYGPLHSPTIINQTTNQQMQVLTDLDYTLTWVNPVEVTGDYILITNETDKESPLSSVELLGNTTQDTLSGKNLLDIAGSTAATGSSNTNGITTTISSDGKLTISGTSTNSTGSNGWANLTAYKVATIPAGTYTFSTSKTTSFRICCRLHFTDSTYTNINIEANASSAIATISKTVDQFYIYIDHLGTSAISTNFYVQLESGSTATSYEPYCGGIPAPNPTYPIAVQTTTGEQFVNIAGKNLFDVSATPWVNKVAYDASGNKASWSGYYGIEKYQPVQPNTTYRFSNSTNKAIYYGLVYYDANKTKLSNITASTTTFTTPANCYFIRFAIQYGSAPTWTQLELGSTATDFEPYQSQSYEVNLTANLFNSSENTTDYYINSSGAEAANANWDISDYIPVVAGQTYSYQGLTQVGNAPYSAFYNASKTFVSSFKQAVGNNTITIPSGVAYVRFSIYHSAQYDDDDNQTFKFWDTPNAIELCKLGTYQDKIYKSGDDWYVHKEVGKAKISELTWAMQQIGSSSNYRIRTSDLASVIEPPATNDTPPDLLCSHYAPKTAGQTNTSNQGISVQSAGSTVLRGWVLFYDSNYHSSNSLSGWQSTDAYINGSFYYALATPVDEQITNQALIDQLDTLASSTLFVGVNNIALVPSGGAQGELTVEYFSAYTEERDIVVIDSQARTITKNGADIYYLKADGSEFPTLAPGENTLYLTSEQTSDEGYAEIKFKQGYLSI